MGNSDRAGNPDRVVIAQNYVITEADALGAGGAKTKFKDNIQAIQTLLELRNQNRTASPEEQAVLVKYVGWGGLPQAFDPNNDSWQKEYAELLNLLPEHDYQNARRSTQDAHYTPSLGIQAIYKGLSRLGFTGGKVLESSAGIGHFIGLMPEAMRQDSQFTAIELDPTTADIGKHLYPTSTYINKGFHEVAIPSEHFDACVGNPPFGTQSLFDPHHRDLSSFSIHNYFLAKSIETLRPGGVMGVIVSRFFMDANQTDARAHIAERAHLLGAIRLPNDAFKKNALTEVTTDILFFQKAHLGEKPSTEWVQVGTIRDHETGQPITLNQYFVDRPEQMLGQMVISNRMGRDVVDLLPRFDLNLEEAIDHHLNCLPVGVYSPRPVQEEETPTIKPLVLPDTLKVGSFFVTPDQRLAKRLPDVLDDQQYILIDTKTDKAAQRIRGMIELRDHLRALIEAEKNEWMPEGELDVLRRALNQKYDLFIKKHGFISAQSNRLAMSEDPDYPLLHALESDYDKGLSVEIAKKYGTEPREPSAKKAPIFLKRVIRPRAAVQHVGSAKEALVVCMNEKGRVDLTHMARLTQQKEQDIQHELSGLIYLDPTSKTWATADQYLTGNVKGKLKVALIAAEHDHQFLSNVNALRAVQPADIDPVDISIQLGSTWVPSEDVSAFVEHLLGDVRKSISHQASIGKWLVKIERPRNQVLAENTWGIKEYPAHELIEVILSNQFIQVRQVTGRSATGAPIYAIDEAKSMAAQQKAEEIKQAFLDWVWEDPARRDRLARIYNDQFNTHIPTQYDGSHLTLDGTSLHITLRPHQKDAIWRGTQAGTALFDHVVGAGKTLICIGTIMESKRMGLMNKPMLVVPNHLLLQWKDAFYSLYPQANILVADKSDFQKDKREILFSRIATGDWDAVVVAHSSFKKIGMPEDTLQAFLTEQIDDLTSAIFQLRSESGDRLTIKEMEKARDRMEARLEAQSDTGQKDKSVTFADLGVDALFVDEAHEFKNLFIVTKMSRVSGLGNLSGSDKAFDLFVKCRYLQQKNNGRGVFFATGTPISNTMAELYTMQRFLQYDEMKAKGIANFDAWASTFGQVVSGWELDATGVNYKINSRFSKFQNVPELVAMYRSFADVITLADLEAQARAQGQRFPVPKVKGGKPQNVLVERSAELARFMGVQEVVRDEHGHPMIKPNGDSIKKWNEGSIIHRMENLPKDPRIDNPLKVTNDARKAGLDYRLVDPDTEDNPNSKINAAVEQIYRIWVDWQERKGTQLVFCDLSTPKWIKNQQEVIINPNNEEEPEPEESNAFSMDELLAQSNPFSVYDDIKSKLVDFGIPEREIRFIHDAKTDVQKSKLFEDMNEGRVRILLGSTTKMGAGTNVQRRLVALHHLDAPWRPSDLEQREGRIIRQGNQFFEENPDGFEVEIFRYATKQTYDSRMWQTIEFKASSIEQFRKGDTLTREIDDIAGQAANAAELKAAATGNPLIFMQVQLSSDLKKMEAVYGNYKRNKHALENRIQYLEGAEARHSALVQRLQAEIQRRDQHTIPDAFVFTSASGHVHRDKLSESLQNELVSVMKHAIANPKALQSVGTYRGFKVSVRAAFDQLQFTIHGENDYEPYNLTYGKNDQFSPSGFFNRIDNNLKQFEEQIRGSEKECQQQQTELVNARSEIHKPFAQLEQLESLREDNLSVMRELRMMQADENYVSNWQPKSAKASDKPALRMGGMR